MDLGNRESLLAEARRWAQHDEGVEALVAWLDELLADRGHPLVYTEVQHLGAFVIVAGAAWVIDSVDVHPVLPGCEPDATAHLSLAPDPPAREPEACPDCGGHGAHGEFCPHAD